MISFLSFIKNRKLYIIYSLLLSITLAQIIGLQKTQAAYEGGRIIDDAVFLDARSMDAAQIQNFLVGKGAGLANMSFTLNCYAQDSKERQWYTAVGAPCDQSIPASHIIYYASQIYGVSPKVILATMQKEQSLTTAPNPTSWQINQAMGYACPTSGQCGGNSTFPYQIDSGTWVLRYHYERARRNNTWWNNNSNWTCGTEKNYYKPNLYPGQNVDFYDQNGVHYRTHYISNPATSSFYCYTPHAYNNPQGLYGRAAFGDRGAYYSGSYNFVLFYELWFGSTYANDTLEPHPSGTLINDNGSVYIVDENVKRYVSANSFKAHGFSWSSIKKATSGDKLLHIPGPLASYTIGTMFTTPGSPVYIVDHEAGNLVKKHVTYEAFLEFGYKWSDVLTFSNSEAPSQNASTALTTNSRHPSGTLISLPNDPKVYLVENGTRRHILNGFAFESYGYKWENIKNGKSNDATMPEGAPLQARRGSLASASGGIYVIDYDANGSLKRPLGPWECFANQLYYTSYDVYSTSLSSLPARTGSLFTC